MMYVFFITVDDANDNYPVFAANLIKIILMDPLPQRGTTIGKVEATDLDSGLFGYVSFRYLMISERFLIFEES